MTESGIYVTTGIGAEARRLLLEEGHEVFDIAYNGGDFSADLSTDEGGRRRDSSREGIEIYFNFVGKYIPPAFREVELTPEEQGGPSEEKGIEGQAAVRADRTGLCESGRLHLPDLTAEPPSDHNLGKYGLLRLRYLTGLFNRLTLSGKLYAHLLETEDAANDLLERMMPGMAKEAGAT